MWSRSGSISSERSSSSSVVPASLPRPDGSGQPSDHAEHGPGEKRGGNCRRQDAELRLLEELRLTLEREARDQYGDGEPDSRHRAAAGDDRPAQRTLKAGNPRSGREPARPEDAERLTQDVAEEDPKGHRRCDGVAEQLRIDVNAGVCECEHRDDHVAGPGVKLVLEPLVRRDCGRHAPLRGPRELRRGLLPERSRQLRHPLELLARRPVRARHEPDRESRHDRVDPGLVQRDPERYAERHRGLPAPARRHVPERHHQPEAGDRQGERQPGERVRVDRRDHHQCHQVVDHGEGEQAKPKAGAAWGHQPQHTESQGGVGRHRRPPAVRPGAARIEGEEDQNGHGHSADRRGHRDRDPLPLAELSRVELTLGLEPHHQEEERHQALVDPVAQVEGDPPAADVDRELGRPKRLVRVRPGRVRPDQRRGRRRQQDNGTARLLAQEVANRRR